MVGFWNIIVFTTKISILQSPLTITCIYWLVKAQFGFAESSIYGNVKHLNKEIFKSENDTISMMIFYTLIMLNILELNNFSL